MAQASVPCVAVPATCLLRGVCLLAEVYQTWILECPPAGWAQLLHPLSQVDAAPCALHGSFETCSFMVFRWEAAQRVTRCNRSETFFPGSQGDEPPPKSARLPHLLSSHSGGGWLPVGSVSSCCVHVGAAFAMCMFVSKRSCGRRSPALQAMFHVSK